MSVSLKSMRYFCTTLKHGSIAKAALELNVAASAVAAAIDQIETHFNLKLLNRQRSKGIQPTASGRAMAQKFNALLEDFDTVLMQGAELGTTLSGSLHIGYSTPIAPAFLPKILETLLSQQAGVNLYFDECDNDAAQTGLLSGIYDAILFVNDVARPQIAFEDLIEAPAYCLLPANHPLAGKKSLSMHDIANEPIIAVKRPLATDYYQKLFEHAQQEPNIIAYADSTEMVRSLVGAGYGCAVLNMIPATKLSYAGDRLIGVPIMDALKPLKIAVGYDKSNPRRLVQHFVERCCDFFADSHSERCIVQQQ